MKVKFIITLAIILLIFFSIFYLFVQKKEKVNENFCNTFAYPLLRRICLARMNKNLSACLAFEGRYKEFCASAVLNDLNVNYSFCKSISDEILRKFCLRKLAVSTGNYEVCEDDYCFFTSKNFADCEKIKTDWLRYTCEAKATGKESFCEKIEDDYERNSCLGLLSKDPSICSNPVCIIYVAINTRDTSLCNNLPTSYTKIVCTAESAKNLDSCNSLEDEYEKELCTILYWGRPLNEIS